MWHDFGRGLVKGNRARLASKHDDCKSSPRILKPQQGWARERLREMENDATNSCPDPHEKYIAAVSDLNSLQHS
jgi:hypothetical protein